MKNIKRLAASLSKWNVPVQAMCDYRKLNAYFFFTCDDLLDAPEWDDRMKKNQAKNTQHGSRHFDIALELACYIVE